MKHPFAGLIKKLEDDEDKSSRRKLLGTAALAVPALAAACRTPSKGGSSESKDAVVTTAVGEGGQRPPRVTTAVGESGRPPPPRVTTAVGESGRPPRVTTAVGESGGGGGGASTGVVGSGYGTFEMRAMAVTTAVGEGGGGVQIIFTTSEGRYNLPMQSRFVDVMGDRIVERDQKYLVVARTHEGGRHIDPIVVVKAPVKRL